MSDLAADDTREFLRELTALSIKHGITIQGCGCCGSPFFERTDRAGHYSHEDSLVGELCWNEDDLD